MESNIRRKWAVYTIRERQGLEKPFWMRVGIAFLNRDGSFNLHLDATPLDGKLHMREWQEEGASLGSNSNQAAESKKAKSNGKAAETAAF